jgi:broad-specificity NMP kinase
MQYDFTTLDPHDFELLVRDILNKEKKLDLQSFKRGKDKGIDLRSSIFQNPNNVVVQVKHYALSGFDLMYTNLKKNEVPKVKKLAPRRYLVVTSVSLNPQQKDKILALFTPFMKNANDVLGKEDINKYLSKLRGIEEKHYKLWMTSVPVMKRILHNAEHGRNEFIESKIRKALQLYVPCESYNIAFNILNEHKYILITGQPGVGKTTLAYNLSYSLLAQGYELLYVDSDIVPAEKLMEASPDAKQFVFFDDFLGDTYFAINNPKTSESAFVTFLERIVNAKNKYLILTTRTTILTNALEHYERFRRVKVVEARKEIVLGEYSILEKAKILFKHVYFSDLPEEYKAEIFKEKRYWIIIVHKNYNPRLVEHITTKKHLPTDMKMGYWNYVTYMLSNNYEVWRQL